MAQRDDLQALLVEVLGSGNVYFQPKEKSRMEYPCIRYEFSRYQVTSADNVPYQIDKRYMLTVIDRDPDSAIPDRVIALPKCVFERAYKADGLYHYVFNLFP